MKFPFLALLSMGTLAVCQSPPKQQAIDPDKLFQLPENLAEPTPNFKALKPLPPLANTLILPRPSTVTPRSKLNDPQIDPKIIVHPPGHHWSKGNDVAPHLFPGLKFLPLQKSHTSQ